MSAWHRFADSELARWLYKRGPTRHLVRTRAFRAADIERNRLRAELARRRNPSFFENARTFCIFVGHNKSGTSLLGALLDAHPRIIVSDELDILQYVEAGFRRDQVFHRVLHGSRAEFRNGRVTARRLVPYSYLVDGQWQGRGVDPLVVGDSTSGSTTRRLAQRPDLIDRVRAFTPPVELKVIQVVRNPFDPISVMMVRGRRTFENAIDHYFTACQRLVDIRNRLGPGSLMAVRYEDMVADPAGRLAEVCRFLGAYADDRYLQACSGIVRPTPDRSRAMVEWGQPWVAHVERRLQEFAFLEGYSYAS
jgi:hypothetical protein